MKRGQEMLFPGNEHYWRF